MNTTVKATSSEFSCNVFGNCTIQNTVSSRRVIRLLFRSAPQHFISRVRCITRQKKDYSGGGGGNKGERAIFPSARIGRQPPFLANLWASLPACPARGAQPETDGSRNVLEQTSEEPREAREAREGGGGRGRGGGCVLPTTLLHPPVPAAPLLPALLGFSIKAI